MHICHSIIHAHKKFQRNKAYIKIIIGIQSRLSHIHWPLFEDEKEKALRQKVVIFTKKSCCSETFAPKWDVEQIYEYNT